MEKTKEEDFEDAEEEEIETRPVYLTEFFTKLLSTEKFADVYFIVGEGKSQKRFPAHRLVLAASSPLFEAMLYPPTFIENPPPLELPMEVVIQETDPESFSLLLQVIYTDEVQVNAENIAALIACAKKYQIEKLQIICADFMEADITADNALELFGVAPELLGDEEFGLEFIRENAEEIFASDALVNLSQKRFATLLRDDNLSIEEQSVFNAVQRWGKNQIEEQGGDVKSIEELKKVIADLLPLIRFPAMDVTDIAAHVAPSGLLEQTQLLELFKYVSTPEGKERSSMEMSFLTTPRQGAFSISETKLIDAKYRKDILKMFGAKKSLKFTLLYRGSRDGFNAASFHGKCDSTTGTFTVIQNKNNGYIFGGYYAGSWSGSGYASEKSFVYSLKNASGKTLKYDPTSTSNNAYKNSSYGPTWGGGHDLHVNNSMTGTSNSCNPNTYKNADSQFGSNVTLNNQTLAGASSFTVGEIEVFAVKQK